MAGCPSEILPSEWVCLFSPCGTRKRLIFDASRLSYPIATHWTMLSGTKRAWGDRVTSRPLQMAEKDTHMCPAPVCMGILQIFLCISTGLTVNPSVCGGNWDHTAQPGILSSSICYVPFQQLKLVPSVIHLLICWVIVYQDHNFYPSFLRKTTLATRVQGFLLIFFLSFIYNLVLVFKFDCLMYLTYYCDFKVHSFPCRPLSSSYFPQSGPSTLLVFLWARRSFETYTIPFVNSQYYCVHNQRSVQRIHVHRYYFKSSLSYLQEG